MQQAETINRGSSIITFLADPQDRVKFDAFFQFCYHRVLGYLYFLQAKGYQLSVDSSASGSPLHGLTIDILGSLLRRKKGQPFYLVFDYFHQNGITDFQNADSDELYEKFKALLFRFIRQELSKLKNETDPQIANLKRRINEILKRDNYIVLPSNPSGIERVMLSNKKNQNLTESPIIPYEEILRITEESYLKSNNRVEWCRNIFETLDMTSKYQKILIKHELISAIIAVNSKYVEVENIKSVYTHDAEEEILLRKAEQSIQEILPWLRMNILENFIEKRRLTPEYADCFAKAAEMYLRDFVFSPPTDLLPQYFREVMPPDEHKDYLKKYKYLFETAIQKIEEEFLRRLKIFYNR
jgi:hypothetical protein